MLPYLRQRVLRFAFWAAVLSAVFVALLLTLSALLRRSFTRRLLLQPSGASPLTGTLSVRDGHLRLYADRVDSLSDASLQIIYQQQSHLEITAECSQVARIAGEDAVHTWNLCLAGSLAPHRSCLAFSFGSRAAGWQFEARVAKSYGCQVFVFDPLMPSRTTIGDSLCYLREGLVGENPAEPGGGFTDSYSGHLKRFRAQELLVDFLKLDTGESTLHAVFAAASDGSLNNVKQLLIATPVTEAAVLIDQIKLEIRTFAALHQTGFRLWQQSLATLRGGQRRKLHFVNAKLASSGLATKTSHGEHLDLIGRLRVVKLQESDQPKNLSLSLVRMPRRDQQDVFNKLTQQTQFHCPNRRIVSSWDICITEPFDLKKRQPCVAFSFVIGNSFEFDANLADDYHCHVYMIGPDSIHQSNLNLNGKTARFSRTRLSATGNTVERNGLSVLTLCSAISDMGYSTREIDVMRLDLDGTEWAILSKAIKEGCLKLVRQLVVRIHPTARAADYYATGVRTLAGLHSLGFANWNLRSLSGKTVISTGSADVNLINPKLAGLRK